MKQMEKAGSAPGFAQENKAPKGVHSHCKTTSAPQAKSPAPNSGQTATSPGGRGKGTSAE